MSRQGRGDEDRGDRDYDYRGQREGQGRSGGSFGNDYNDRPYERSMDRSSQMNSGTESYRGEDQEWGPSRGFGGRQYQNRDGEMGMGGRTSYGNAGGNWGNERQQSSSGGRGEQSQHVGRGPKGYRRADERIEEDVNEALTDSPDLDASEIEVKVSNGEVTLSGTVTERSAKRTAEDVAERCSGVKDVRNEIRVQRESDSGTNGQSQLRGKSAAGTNSKTQESKSA
jgi:osmotically-inducible protein OsmY